MYHNFLLLNSDKAEVTYYYLLWIALPCPPVTLRNPGVFFQQDLPFNEPIQQKFRTAFIHLHNIAQSKNILSQSDAEKLVYAFITTGLNLQFIIIRLFSKFSKKLPINPKHCSVSTDRDEKVTLYFSLINFLLLAPC